MLKSKKDNSTYDRLIKEGMEEKEAKRLAKRIDNANKPK
jgi:hypothetical protein